MSLYLLANQWVTAIAAKKRRGKDNAETQSALRFAESKTEISPERTEQRRDDKFELAGKGMGDFTKDGGTARAGGGGDVAGALVERFVGH